MFRSVVILRLMIACTACAILGACTTASHKQAQAAVRKVDFTETPGFEEYTGHFRKLGNAFYPQVCSLLAESDTRFPQHFDLFLKPRLPSGNSGETRSGEVFLDVSYLEGGDEDLTYCDHVLVHEMAHVAQHYSRPILGHWVYYTSRPPNCWQEGIADYICFKLCQTDPPPCECGFRFPHYLNGYSCAGAFLLYLEKTYNSNVVRRLNTVLRKGNYSDDFFLTVTGKPLPELWSEFQKTAAFTPNAARMLALQSQLGFVNGKPPKDIRTRFQSLLNQPTNAPVKELLRHSTFDFAKKWDEPTSLSAFLYFSQPGGTAETYLIKLHDENRLPGIEDTHGAELTGRLKLSDMDSSFPCARTFTVTKQDDPSTYHYTVFSPARGAQWSIQRAWRTAPDGAFVEQFKVP